MLSPVADTPSTPESASTSFPFAATVAAATAAAIAPGTSRVSKGRIDSVSNFGNGESCCSRGLTRTCEGRRKGSSLTLETSISNSSMADLAALHQSNGVSLAAEVVSEAPESALTETEPTVSTARARQTVSPARRACTVQRALSRLDNGIGAFASPTGRPRGRGAWGSRAGWVRRLPVRPPAERRARVGWGQSA